MISACLLLHNVCNITSFYRSLWHRSHSCFLTTLCFVPRDVPWTSCTKDAPAAVQFSPHVRRACFTDSIVSLDSGCETACCEHLVPTTRWAGHRFMCECTGSNRLGENDFFSEVGERGKKTHHPSIQCSLQSTSWAAEIKFSLNLSTAVISRISTVQGVWSLHAPCLCGFSPVSSHPKHGCEIILLSVSLC